MFGQEIVNNRSAFGESHSSSKASTRSVNDTDHLTALQIYRTSTGSRPHSLVYDKAKMSRVVSDPQRPGLKANRCNRRLDLKGKASESNRCPVWVLISIEGNSSNSPFWNSCASKRILDGFTHSQVNGSVSVAIREPIILEGDVVLEFSPTVIGDVNGWNASVCFFDSSIPFVFIDDVCISDKATVGVDKEARSGNESNLEFFVYVKVPAHNRNNRMLDSFDCWDGDSFRCGVAADGTAEKCDDTRLPHDGGGSGSVSDDDLRRNYRLTQ